jgi:hypothetical protein
MLVPRLFKDTKSPTTSSIREVSMILSTVSFGIKALFWNLKLVNFFIENGTAKNFYEFSPKNKK